MLLRPYCIALAVSVLYMLSSCGSSSSEGDPTDTLTPSALTSSGVISEQFGTITGRDREPNVTESDQSALVGAMNDFSFDLHRQLVAASPTEDAVSSGYSAAVALTLASAATAGETRAALANLLGVDALDESVLHAAQNSLALALESRSNDRLDLRTANRLFVRPGLALEDAFLDVVTSDYSAPVSEADFAGSPAEVTDSINAWVAEQTDDFITSILSEPLDSTTVFALLNAIFLDAAWQNEYQALDGRIFTALDGSSTDVDSFGGRGFLPVLVREDLTALEIPYAGDLLAMTILMPDDLAAFEATLDAEALATTVAALASRSIEFSVPNWQSETMLDLVELLGPLGLPAGDWNFGRLVEGGIALEVKAIQKAKIMVDEKGTRAAAVTLVATDESVPESVLINRPFVYVLRDRDTGTVLFTGRVVAP